MVTTIRCDWHGAMGRCAQQGSLYPRAGVRGGASCEARAGYIDPSRRKTVAWSPSGGRSASRVASFDGAAGGNGQRRRDADFSERRQLLRERWRACGRRRALLSPMRPAPRRPIRRFAKCRCEYNFQVAVDGTIGSAFADRSIAYASHRRTRIARCHSQPRCSSADARDCSDPSGLATLHCGPSRVRPYRSQLRPHLGIERDIPPENRDTRRSR